MGQLGLNLGLGLKSGLSAVGPSAYSTKALLGDGVDSYGTLADPSYFFGSNPANTWGDSFWFKSNSGLTEVFKAYGSSVTGGAQSGFIRVGIGSGGNVWLDYRQDGAGGYQGAVSALTIYHDNQWHHVYWESSGGTLRFFVDKVLQGATIVMPLSITANQLNVGRSMVGGQWQLPTSALLDEMNTVIGSVWTAADVLKLFGAGIPPDPVDFTLSVPATHRYRFGETPGDTYLLIQDSIATADMTLTSYPTTSIKDI